MKKLLALASLALATCPLHAVFNGMDNFAGGTIDNTKWGPQQQIQGSTASFTQSGALYFETPGVVASGIALPWLQTGGFNETWQLTINAERPNTLNLNSVADAHVEVGLIVYRTDTTGAPPPNHLGIYLDTYVNGSGTQIFDVYTSQASGGVTGAKNYFLTNANAAALRIGYDNTSQTLTASYDVGGGWVSFTTINNVGTAWSMDNSKTFSAVIEGSATGKVISTADAVRVTSFTTAIPEPATVAPLLGLAALSLALYRRRKAA